ncbi:MAG: hypothetical protein EOO88_36445 [Pedobacter sp.]|nr:MAG: hypothetical protein EOO88_36445 [Pedobacter sp.]
MNKFSLAFPPVLSRCCLLLFISLCISASLLAQTVTGSVVDNEKKPVSGATIAVKGTTKATSTNATGNFSIEASSNDILIVTYVGFGTLEVPVAGQSNLTLTLMRGDGSDLDVVVVTALGIKRQARALGYASSSVKNEDITINRTTNVMESLEGRISGLNITPPAAGAGASTQIRLRGQVGFAGSTNSPLIVVNGLPMDQGARSADGGGAPRDQGDNLQTINPDDIETMTVLKWPGG